MRAAIERGLALLQGTSYAPMDRQQCLAFCDVNLNDIEALIESA